ncbi:MAG TPA: DUF3108 domain-containing protein [Bacteroidota bacterium]|nr:DUF3108 domain-containing protein [Bacteroidota bacterium]
MRFALASLVVSALAFAVLPSPTPDSVATIASVMVAGEELVYEVKWTFIKLGRIRVVTLPGSGKGVYRSVAYSDSYDLPFVDFHAYSTSEMDSTLFSRGSSLFEKNGNRWYRQMYFFDPGTRRYITEHAFVDDLHHLPAPSPTYDTIEVKFDRFQDGTSILYFARAHIHSRRAIAVPTLVRGKAGRTEFYLPAEQTTETIDAVPYPIRVMQLEGRADFEGIFGLTGDFVGWFSDDAAAVPIKAKMKVILGSINIELIEWKRDGWSPPRAE